MNPFTLSSAGVANGMSVAGFGGAGADGGGTGLASHAAQMGFARGAQMQQQQLSQGHDGRLALDVKAGAVKTRIRDVWKHNLAHEMAVLRQLVDKYPYISMVRHRPHRFLEFYGIEDLLRDEKNHLVPFYEPLD
jgi:CCR4-NOT transcription complex subunit 7/8